MSRNTRTAGRALDCLKGLATVSAAALAVIAGGSAFAQANPRRAGAAVSLNAADLAALVRGCGGAEATDQALELVRKHACSRSPGAAGEVLAFEENASFLYAQAEMERSASPDPDAPARAGRSWLRRLVLLKPATLIIEDLVPSSAVPGPCRWSLRCAAEADVDGCRFRVTEGDAEIAGQMVLPAGGSLKGAGRPAAGDRPAMYRVQALAAGPAEQVRFLHVFQFGSGREPPLPLDPEVVTDGERSELRVTVAGRVVRWKLPADDAAAGRIQITAADGSAVVRERMLPSGIMPHGPEGARLMERWDAAYRRDQLPGWDVGRPCSHLVRAVADGTFPPGRAIVLGCGSGNNAIYLAEQGFQVIGVDVAPTALEIAAAKAREAGVQVQWILADVVALPKLPACDLVFDRGCYHHICQYDSPAYVASLRRISRAGTRALILAGSPADGNRGGPPRVAEETIRRDFSELFEFVWLRSVQFDTRNAPGQGASAWSIHLRRKGA